VRLLIVTNRLPITVVQKDGEFSYTASPGGLSTGLTSYLTAQPSGMEYVWIGWPGSTLQGDVEQIKAKLYADHRAYPVFLSEEDMEMFYHGFCNKTIWALFHYFTSYVVYEEEYWKHYKKVNETFCDVVAGMTRPGDVIWIHDYHLMLLPRMLRERIPGASIGFFLHIPFPDFEVFRLLPSKWRSEILEGLLGADLVGFHTHDYVQYFLRCVQRILGYEHNMGELLLTDRMAKVDTFPMGIEFQKFFAGPSSESVLKEKAKLRETLGNERVVLSMDRLDYSKGIAHRLRGYDCFLERNPDWHGKVVLLLVVVPSRIGVEHYQEIKRQIEELVGNINGKFARIPWSPIHYQYRSILFDPMVALYSMSDVLLVTPLRDGMNLIAKEYVASRTDGTGVLILSEMAGSAKELSEAILINPNNVEEIADSLAHALRMPVEEQKRRNQAMQQRLQRYDVTRWANDFLQSLRSIGGEQKKLDAHWLSGQTRDQLVQDFRSAQRRLLILDYDGTLVPYARNPLQAIPGGDLPALLGRLAVNSDVVLCSGRERNILDKWFGTLGMGLVAEHGVWIRRKNEEWKMLKALNNDWKAQILPIFEIYADRLPGAIVEEKEFSLAYHYRKADPELASMRVKELTDNLVYFTANLGLQVLHGHRVLEMRNAGINKGAAALHFLNQGDYDFILTMGDDATDEDVFRVLPPDAYSIRVGRALSHARFNLPSHQEVQRLLQELL